MNTNSFDSPFHMSDPNVTRNPLLRAPQCEPGLLCEWMASRAVNPLELVSSSDSNTGDIAENPIFL